MRRAGLINLPGNAAPRGQTLTNEIAACVAECCDEHQLVVLTRCEFAKWIVEQNRSRLGRHELIRLLKDLAQHQIEIDVCLERQTALMALEETLELRCIQRVKLNHRTPQQL